MKNHLPYYLYTHLGYALKSNNSAHGAMGEIGMGYKHMFRKHFGLKFDLGYNLKNFREKVYDFELEKNSVFSSCRHSFNVGIGMIF